MSGPPGYNALTNKSDKSLKCYNDNVRKLLRSCYSGTKEKSE